DWGGTPVAIDRLRLRQRGDAPEQFELAVPTLDLAQVQALLARGPLLPPLWRDVIGSMAPTGAVRSLYLTLPTAPRHSERLLLRAEVADLTLQPWREAPGVSGGHGYVEVDMHGG